MNYHAINHDNEIRLQLRTCSLNDDFDAIMKAHQLRLRSIKTDELFDLVCQVLYVQEISNNEWMIFVWDGTDTPPVSLKIDVNFEGKDPLPLQLEALRLPKEVLSALPHVGSILRITAPKTFKEIPQLQDGDYWVKICNMTCQLQLGLWRGLLNPSSKIYFLTTEDENVKLNKRDYKERIQCKIQRQPLTSFPLPSHITEIEYEGAPYRTLIESLANPKVIHQCKTIVRVVATYPWKVDQFSAVKKGYYLIRLTLEDPTARIHAYIYGEDGVKFFEGYPSHDILYSKMRKLLGINESINEAEMACALRDPPWVWCCLKSYCFNKNDLWGSRMYRIFGTSLVG